jgi:hypothetical protein
MPCNEGLPPTVSLWRRQGVVRHRPVEAVDRVRRSFAVGLHPGADRVPALGQRVAILPDMGGNAITRLAGEGRVTKDAWLVFQPRDQPLLGLRRSLAGLRGNVSVVADVEVHAVPRCPIRGKGCCSPGLGRVNDDGAGSWVADPQGCRAGYRVATQPERAFSGQRALAHRTRTTASPGR